MDLQTYLMIKQAARNTGDARAPGYYRRNEDGNMEFVTPFMHPALDADGNPDFSNIVSSEIVVPSGKHVHAINDSAFTDPEFWRQHGDEIRTGKLAPEVVRDYAAKHPFNPALHGASNTMEFNPKTSESGDPTEPVAVASKPAATDAPVSKPVEKDTVPVNKNKPKDMKRIITQYGLGAAGAGLGGTAGYAGSNWLSKKLGLKGKDGWNRAGDIALRTLGTAGGAALGGYGGYRLGDYINNRVYGE